jgi:hypothetical protein
VAYSFLVALSARHVYGLQADTGVAARLFERVVVPALRQYWGGEAEHFGWPRSAAELAAFPEAMALLVRRMRERLNVDLAALPGRLKDLEVDAVAWRPLDERRGQTVMLCQAAIGAEWEEKGIHVEQWEKIVTFAVRPTRGLAFPFLAEAMRDLSPIDWELLCAKVGVPFDRLRLAKLLAGIDLEDDLVSGILAWTESVVPAIGEMV